MSDWRQIQARIRKAKAGDDPCGQLTTLYEKTHDAMVAFELARLQEKSGQNDEAVRWYTAAAERFRRPQWKSKAEESLARLGAPMPLPAVTRQEGPVEPIPKSQEPIPEQPSVPLEPAAERSGGREAAPAPGQRRRRRGRRGGRGRRSGQRAQAQGAPLDASTASGQASAQGVPEVSRPHPAPVRSMEVRAEPAPEPGVPPGPGQAAAPQPAWQIRGRAGEPALASRLAQLESQLRRLTASPLYRVDQADQAPAGPGVFIVSDSDQTTYYHIEACQTLRIGIRNLLRGERGVHRGSRSLRERFAEHLGIGEARVSKYLREQCGVRWLQLDEGAAALAHFAIAVLRPALND